MTANFVLLTLRTQATPPYAVLYKVLCMPIESRGLLTCARDTRIVAVATIRERRLFLSACLEVRLLFESGD